MGNNRRGNVSLFRRIFRSDIVSTTNPRRDVRNQYGEELRNDIEVDTTSSRRNVQNIINQLRQTDYSQTYYDEYDEMESEVIISASLKTYADDATVSDPTSGKVIWVSSEDQSIADELNSVIESLGLDDRAWSIIYSIAKYGDYYMESIFNDKGYLIGTKPFNRPQDIYHLMEDTEESGFLVKTDDRKVRERSQEKYDVYSEGAFTHFYLNDSPRNSNIVVEVIGDDGEIKYLDLEVSRGRSIIEPARMTYRVLRLLEDTMITNKIARSEYLRIVNVEVGDASGKKASTSVSKLKRLFDSKPRYDGQRGEYSSQRQYRPSNDTFINATSQGVGALSVNELGGNVETQHMADVDYFKNKIFTGVGVPKAFLGFEDSVTSGLGDGAGTLAQLDIRYSRGVRRLQKAFIRGVEDMMILYLVSRNRMYDAGNFEVHMSNPSSAEELARLGEIGTRVELINTIVGNVADIAGDSTNLPKLYTDLFETFINDSGLVTVFEDSLVKAVASSYITSSINLANSRVDLINANAELVTAVHSAERMYTEGSVDPMDDQDDFDDPFTPSGGGSSGPSLGGGSTSFDDLGDIDIDSEEDDLDLGDLSPDDDVLDDIDISGSDDELLADIDESDLQSYRGSRSTSTVKVLDSLSTVSTYGPTQFKSRAEELISEYVTSHDKSLVTPLVESFMREVDDYYNDLGYSDDKLSELTEALTGRDKDRRKLVLSKIFDEE